MIRRPPRSTQSRSSAASDVYKRQTLPLWRELHLFTVFLELLRQVLRAHAALFIARHGIIDELGIRQLERLHDGDEFGKAAAAAEAGVALALLRDGRDPAFVVVVGGIDQQIVGQGEKLVVDAAVKQRGVAVLEVGAAASVDQQRVSGENAVAEQKCEMTVGVAR